MNPHMWEHFGCELYFGDGRHIQISSQHGAAELFEAHNAAVRAAVAAEREACARVALAANDVYNIGFCIAADIRARGTS